MTYRRIFLIVLDSVGAGAMPDAGDYGDAGADTLGHISQAVEKLSLPHLQKLGLGNLHPMDKVPPIQRPLARYGKLRERSAGKDTMTGHWEMMGLLTTEPFQTFTDTGFPPELIRELERRTGREIIGNKAASGTEILEELGAGKAHRVHLRRLGAADLRQRGDHGLRDPLPVLRTGPAADLAAPVAGGAGHRPSLRGEKAGGI